MIKRPNRDSTTTLLIYATCFYAFCSIIVGIALFSNLNEVRAQSGVRINEIMYAPIAPEPEWIELFNPGTLSVSLNGWGVLVKTKNTLLGAAMLPAGGYIVLTKDSATLRARHPNHPFTILQFALPALANTGDEVMLLDSQGNLLDSLHYYPAWGGKSGTSVERISIVRPSTDSTNWGSSIAQEGSTPGLQNSISTSASSLAIKKVIPAFIHDTLVVQLQIFNNGSIDVDHTNLFLYRDDNHDSVFKSDELIDSISLPLIVHGTTLDTTLRLINQPLTQLYYEARIAVDSSQLSTSDTATFSFLAGLAVESVVLNEVMYAPVSPEPEWIELYNRSSDSINLAGCIVRNLKSSFGLIPDSTFIPPQGSLVLTKDDSTLRTLRIGQTSIAHIVQCAVPDLPNGGGTITLLDARASQVDSLVYLPSWGGATGKSLERIDFDLPALDSTNLQECVDPTGATLGLPNSVRKRNTELALQAVWDSNATDGTITLFARLQNKGKTIIDTASLTVQSLENTSGLPIATLTLFPHLLPGDFDTVTVSFPVIQYGVNDFVVFVTTLRDTAYSNDTLQLLDTISVPRNGLALNEVMFTPLGISCQWVELYNTTHLPIECSTLTLKVFDGATKHLLPLIPAVIPSSSFAIVAADSTTFYNAYSSLTTHPDLLGLSRSTLELTSSAGSITILNSDSTVIDTFSFFSNWLPKLVQTTYSGVSLERISRDRSTLDSTNWLACVADAGATPFAENSVSARAASEVGAVLLQTSPNPFSPDGDGVDDVTTIGFTTGSTTESSIRLRVFDMRGRVVRTLLDGSRFYLTGTSMFDGKSDSGTALSMGVYTLLLDCTDASGNTKSVRTGVVIAKRVR